MSNIVFIPFSNLTHKNSIYNIIPNVKSITTSSELPTDIVHTEEQQVKIPLVRTEASSDLLRRLESERNEIKRRKIDTVGSDTSQTNETKNASVNKVTKFVELKEFSDSINSDINQQILTVAIELPPVANYLIEKLLVGFINPLLEEFDDNNDNQGKYKLDFSWSVSSYENGDCKIGYVKFHFTPDGGKLNDNFIDLDFNKDVKIQFLHSVVVKFVKSVDEVKLDTKTKDEYGRSRPLSKQLKVTYEVNTGKLMSMCGDFDETEIEESRKKFKENAEKIIKEYNIPQKEIQSDNSEYIVNVKELSDMPKQIIPQMVEDIKNFRACIVKAEKKKQAQTLLEDKRRARIQMRKMLSSVSKIEKRGINGEDYDDEDEEMDSDDSIDDLEYEKMMEKNKQEQIETEMATFYTQIQRKEANLKKIRDNLKALQNYNQQLEAKRPLYMKDYEYLFDNEGEISLDQVVNADLREVMAKYQRDQVGYMQARSVQKLKEQNKEEADRAAEAKEEKTSETETLAPFKLNLKAKEQPVADKLYGAPNQDLRNAVQNASSYLDELLQEYIGMSETELTKYLETAVVNKTSKADILEELANVLDEDAKGFLEKYWKKLEEVI